MEHFRLQIGCLTVLIYVAVVYFQGCSKYHVKITASYFWKLLLLGISTVIFDGAMAWVTAEPEAFSPIWGYIFHAMTFIGLDSTIFFLSVYILNLMDRYPKKKTFLLYIPLIVNIALVLYTIGLQDYLSGTADHYTTGAAIVICFAMIGLYISLIVITILQNSNQINSEKFRGIVTFLNVYAMISFIQMIFSESLASMSIGVTILVLGIYLNSEDPAVKELGKYYSETVMSFANLIEERDGSTGGHIKRTSRYVSLIAKELKKQEAYKHILTKDYIDNLLEAAPMHDIGKIAIPDDILKKPGKLSDEEYEIMKSHAENGGKIIVETFGKFLEKDYCDMAYQVARHHHEKWNGRGYPDGLKEEEIPLAARIMAVADVFDAVSEKRCYRDAMPMDQCFEIIEKGRGQDFDPAVADVFLRLRKEVEKAHEELGTTLPEQCPEA